MIHAFALEPRLVATWGRYDEYRFIYDKFGIGTPRVLLELPDITEWMNAVSEAAAKLEFSDLDWTRLGEVFRIFEEHRCRRASCGYSEATTWLENAEQEYARLRYRAIVATENPRRNSAVLVGRDLGQAKAKLWVLENGAAAARSPGELSAALSPMIANCCELHLVDQYFNPGEARHREVLEALMNCLVDSANAPNVVRIHCNSTLDLRFFDDEAAKMARRLPAGISIDFIRLSQKDGGEKLHNRYVLTDLGGVSLGVGLDKGDPGETDDLVLLPRSIYQLRWSQYVAPGDAFICVDRPARIVGSRAPTTRR